MIDLKCGDCLELMKDIPDKSIDLILCDLPYGCGKTANKWDCEIDLPMLWERYKRILKDDGIIALFSQEPFTSQLILSNIDMYRYKWFWQKESPTGFLNCNYKPLSIMEEIPIFAFNKVGSLSKEPIRYFPQGLIPVNREKRNRPNSTWRKNKGYGGNNKLNSDEKFIQKYTNYPTEILKFPRDKNCIHPTQKPVALLKYIINTYTNENDLVLDNCMGSGSTGVACISTNRNFIGIEKNIEYYKLAENRIKEITEQITFF